jgi:hypothetical protein
MVAKAPHEIVENRLKKGADVHLSCDEALNIACYLGREDILKLLLEYGANVFAQEQEALGTAVSHDHYTCTMMLIDYGADISYFSDKKYFDIFQKKSEKFEEKIQDYRKMRLLMEYYCETPFNRKLNEIKIIALKLNIQIEEKDKATLCSEILAQIYLHEILKIPLIKDREEEDEYYEEDEEEEYYEEDEGDEK